MEIWNDFISKELRRLRKGSRSYLHFDYVRNVKRNTSYYKDKLTNPQSIVSHNFFPFLKVIIKTPRFKKDNSGIRKLITKPRPIMYASHFDSLLYSYYSSLISSKYEKYLHDSIINNSVLAYRSIEGKSNIEFARDTFKKIIQTGECVVLALDIKSFFEEIDHQILKDNWGKILKTKELPEDHFKVFKSLTKYSFVNKEEVLNVLSISNKKRKKIRRLCNEKVFRNIVRKLKLINVNENGFGIPQGSPMSGLLSNISMIDFDEFAKDLVKNYGGEYYRYSDDLLFIVKGEPDLLDLKKQINKFIVDKLNLRLNLDKEEIVKFKKNGVNLQSYKYGTEQKKNLQYLGFEFNGSKVLIRSSSMSKYHSKIKRGVFRVVKRALGSGSKDNTVRKSKLYKKYTHVGNSNFISYAYRAAQVFEEIDGQTIKKQVSGHVNKLEKTIKKKVTFRKRKLKRKHAFTNKEK